MEKKDSQTPFITGPFIQSFFLSLALGVIFKSCVPLHTWGISFFYQRKLIFTESYIAFTLQHYDEVMKSSFLITSHALIFQQHNHFSYCNFFMLFHHIQKTVDENLVVISSTTKGPALTSQKKISELLCLLLTCLHFWSQTKSETKRADSKLANIPSPNYCHLLCLLYPLARFWSQKIPELCFLMQLCWTYNLLHWKRTVFLSCHFLTWPHSLPLLMVLQILLLPCVISSAVLSLVWD